MKEAVHKVVNKSGLHARPASKFVQLTRQFTSKIIICKGGKCADAKNILQVLSLGVDFGDVIEIRVEGIDEDVALTEIIDFLNNKLPSEDA